VAAAIAAARADHAPNADQVARLAALRQSFEELTQAYEALRRMVERGYLPYQSKA
jgi:acyl carrier protein phosphodiesterase